MIEKLQPMYLLNVNLSDILKSYGYGTSVLEKHYSCLVEIREMQNKKRERDVYVNLCF